MSSRVEALLSARGGQLDDLFYEVGLKEKPPSETTSGEQPSVETRSTKQVSFNPLIHMGRAHDILETDPKKPGRGQKLTTNKKSTILKLSSLNLVKWTTSLASHFDQVS